MRRSTLSLTAALGTVAALTLAGCGGSDDTSSNSASGGASSSASGGGAASAVCKSPSTVSAGGGATAAPSISAANVPAGSKVGVILPDTTSSTRYTLYDAPLLTKAFDAAGIASDIQNAQGSTAKFQQIAQSLIGEGVKVLIIDSIDQTSGAAVEQQAKAAGIPVIDYDRVNLGGSAAYYVSFDNEGVGTLQAKTLVDCLKDVSKPSVIEMNGGTDVDNNAVLFAKGANDVLKPLADKGDLSIASQSVVKGWDVSTAAPTFTQALTAAGGQVQGVLAANDDIANAVIGVLKQQGLDGHVVVTGQDAGVVGLQNILQGTQTMTIYKDVATEANTAAALAIALISGQDPSSLGIELTSGIDPKNGELKSLLIPAQVIVQSNVQDVIDAGALTAAEICNGIQDACDKAGIK